MHIEIKYRPAGAIAKVTYEAPNESFLVESSAMVAKSSAIKMKTGMKGGMLKAVARKAFAGENLFQNTFTSTAAGETLYFAPGSPGDMMEYQMHGPALMIASNYFVASDPSIEINTKFAGVKGFFSGTGLALVRATGTGRVFLGSAGGFLEIEVGPEGYVIDNDNLVAFEDTLDYKVEKAAKGFGATFLSGEGLVCKFSGSGKLWISTRSASSIAAQVAQFVITS